MIFRIFLLALAPLAACASSNYHEVPQPDDVNELQCAASTGSSNMIETTIIIVNRTEDDLYLSSGHNGLVLGRSFIIGAAQSEAVWPTHSDDGWTCLAPGEERWMRGFTLHEGELIALSVIVPEEAVAGQVLTSNVVHVRKTVFLSIECLPSGLALVARSE